MQAIIQGDGVYITFGDGFERKVDDCIALVNADGSVTIRIPARSVNVREALDLYRMLDCGDFAKCLLAVVKGGVTIGQIQAVAPGMAALVQTFMTNHGLVAGTVA